MPSFLKHSKTTYQNGIIITIINEMPFNACTYPSSSNYATVPEGQYDAMVGMHNGSKSSYLAIKMYDVGKKRRYLHYNSSLNFLGPKRPWQ